MGRMNWAASEHLTWVSAAALFLAVAGAWLLKRGRWPRRHGSGRYCRRCAYNLSGLSSAQCPECGSELSERNVVIGERRRRAGLAFVGALLLIVSLGGLGLAWWGPLRHVDWYRYKPSRWVAADLRSNDDDLVARAWNELERRRRGGPLNDAVEYAAAEAALAEQGKANGQRGPTLDAMIKYLSGRAAERRLAAGQMDRFFRQGTATQFRVRPVVVAGELVWVHSDDIDRGVKEKGWWTRAGFGPVSIGQSRREGGGGVIGKGIGQPGSLSTFIKPKQDGPQDVTFVVPIQVYRGNDTNAASSELFAQFENILRARVVVESQPSPQNPKLISRPEASAVILRSLKVQIFRRSGGRQSDVSVHFDSPPENLAFAVILRVGTQEYSCPFEWDDAIACLKGARAHGSVPWDPTKLSRSAKGDVTLRSDGAVARQTTDIFEIWDGEIVLRDIPIQDEK